MAERQTIRKSQKIVSVLEDDSVDQSQSIEIFAMMETFCIPVVQYDSHWPRVPVEYLKCG